MSNITQIALLAEHLGMSSEESQIVSEKNEAFWTEGKKKKSSKKKKKWVPRKKAKDTKFRKAREEMNNVIQDT